MTADRELLSLTLAASRATVPWERRFLVQAWFRMVAIVEGLPRVCAPGGEA